MPPVLDRPLRVLGADDGSVGVLDGDALVAEAKPTAPLDLTPPTRPSFAYALEARDRHPGA